MLNSYGEPQVRAGWQVGTKGWRSTLEGHDRPPDQRYYPSLHPHTPLDSVIKSTPSSDKLVLLGDFNARIGCDSETWEGVMGPHGVGKLNNNGMLLLTMCAENGLTVTNNLFRLANKYKTSWMHPRSKQWHLIDYVIVRRRDIRDVKITRAMRGAECWTDHQLIRAILALRIAPTQRKRAKLIRTKFDTTRLQDPVKREAFQQHLDDALTVHGPLTGDPNDKWTQYRQIVTESAKSVLRPKLRNHQDWFDENNEAISKLLDKKRQAFIEWQNDINSTSKKDRFRQLQQTAQKVLREMQDGWWDRKAEEVQNHAESNNAKEFYSSLKVVYGPAKPSITPLLSADGSTLLKDKANIIERWREHFSTLLNRPSTVDPAALDSISQKPVVDDLNLPPSFDEVMKAIKQTSSGKAAGGDNIPAELFKAAGPGALGAFHNILTSIWEEENMPQDFRDATVVSLFKKGNKADCGNYRGISLLSIAGKILARIILNRLISLVSEEALPETQCGFRTGRSTIDIVFTIRQIQEKCIEQHKDLFAVFIDLTKAFDTVNREALWSVLSKLCCPRKFTNLIRLFHDGMQGLVLSNGDTSARFNISNGVKQGCVLAPVLFNLFFTCVLNHALRDLDRGIYLRYRLDGSLFDLRRLNARTKTVERLVHDALFADDCALMAHTEPDLQIIVDRFAEAARLFGLTISLSKTEVMHQPAPGTSEPSPTVSIEGTELKVVEQFTYLGSTISCDGSLDKEIAQRISKASQSLGRLRTRVINHKNIKPETKIKVYKAVVLTSLLYGCETWTTYRKHIKQLERFHMRSLRSIMHIKWQDRVTNLEVLDRAGLVSIETMIMKAQLRWSGHLIRMDSTRLPRQVFYGVLSKGQRNLGRPKKRYKDCIKDSLKHCGIPPAQLEAQAQDRVGWRAAVKKGCKSFEDHRRGKVAAARQRRKEAATAPPTASFPCPNCPRVCGSRIGLISHLRSHQRRLH